MSRSRQIVNSWNVAWPNIWATQVNRLVSQIILVTRSLKELFTVNTLNDYFDYKNNHAPRLQQEVKELFPDKFVSHRTLLREV